MKKLLLLVLFTIFTTQVFSQIVATVVLKERVEGLCNSNKVYALFSFFGDQKEAECSVGKEVIQERLNAEVSFLKTHLKHKDKGMVSFIINCSGEVKQCKTDGASKDPELDKQILAVFTSLTDWKAGKLYGKTVDSVISYSFKIKKGKITLN